MHSLCLCAFVVIFISVGPTVRIASVHRFYYGCALSGLRFAAASLLPAGPPTLQKRSFIANWICRERADPVVVITPAVGSGASPLVFPEKTWRKASLIAKF